MSIGFALFIEWEFRNHGSIYPCLERGQVMNKSIGSYMVKSPYVGDPDLGLKEAFELMKECNIRHLPVTSQDRLAGIVSERDLRAALTLPHAEQLRLSDIMKTDAFVVRRTSPLRDVVRTMQEEKIGSAIIINEDRECIGIFTTIDALGILAEMLDEEEDESRVLFLDDYVEFWNAANAGSN